MAFRGREWGKAWVVIKNPKSIKGNFHAKSSPFADGVPKLQPVNDKMACMEDAQIVQPLLRDIARFIISSAKNDLLVVKGPQSTRGFKTSAYEDGPLKESTRIDLKASREKSGHFDDILDYSRGQSEAETSDQIAALCSCVESMAIMEQELPHGARIVGVENRFSHPTPSGYMSLKVLVAIPIPNGERPYHISELQYKHKGFEKEIAECKSNRFGMDSHSAYDSEREMRGRFKTEQNFRDPARLTPELSTFYGKIIKVCKDMHVNAAKKFGLDKIDFLSFDNYKYDQITKEIEGRETAERNIENHNID